jgi:hypothetical protein|tara:strand:+ start:170 stop:475 length:306 start_codon:yes stop_codon:yes gene_type:complete
MLIQQTTTRRRVDTVQGFTVSSKNLKKGDLVLTKPERERPESVIPSTTIKIIDGYKNRDTRLCEVPLFYDRSQSECGSVLVSDMCAVKRDDMWMLIEHDNK